MEKKLKIVKEMMLMVAINTALEGRSPFIEALIERYPKSPKPIVNQVLNAELN